MLLCLSHSRTIAYVDVLGSEHDANVHMWRNRLEEVMSGEFNDQVNFSCSLIMILPESLCILYH